MSAGAPGQDRLSGDTLVKHDDAGFSPAYKTYHFWRVAQTVSSDLAIVTDEASWAIAPPTTVLST